MATDQRARTRHRVVAAGAVLIAVMLLETAVDHHHSWPTMALIVLSLAPLLVAQLWRSTSAAGLAAAAATTLFAQTAVATAEFGGGVQPTTLLLTMLAVTSVYGARRTLVAVGLVAAVSQLLQVVLIHGLFGLPRLAASTNDDSTIVTLVATSLGAWALLLVWRDQRSAERFAAQRDQISATYRDILPMVSIRLDRQGRVLDANRMTCLLLDVEVEAVIGQDWFTLALPPEYQEEGRRYFERAAAGADGVLGQGIARYTNEILAADGTRRRVEWSAGWIDGPSGERQSLLAVGRDVTEELAARAEATRTAHEMDELRRMAQKVASVDDSRQAVVDSAVGLTGAVFASIVEPDRQDAQLTVTIATDPQAVGTVAALDREAPTAEAYRTARPVYAYGEAGLGFAVHQPIVGADGANGVLVLAWEQAREGERERRSKLAALIAHEAAISLRRRASIHALERAALVDPLTNVANRRAFDAELPAALRRAQEAGGTVSLAILDLNGFKAVNDTQGHEAGDDVLVRCAEAWTDVLRRGDLLARLGGDEFALILSRCDERELHDIMGRVRRSTPHGPGTAIGGATWDGAESPAELIRRADADQYADKQRCHARGARR